MILYIQYSPYLINLHQIISLDSFLHNPVFVFLVKTKEDEVGCYSYNLSGALYRVFSSYMSGNSGFSTPKELGGICHEARDSNRCVVLFAEGARTNGDGILRFSPEVAIDVILCNQCNQTLSNLMTAIDIPFRMQSGENKCPYSWISLSYPRKGILSR